MTSPFKTHETMDLARALLEQDSSYTNCSGNAGVNNNDDLNSTKSMERSPFNPSDFHNIVISKDSSTELIPTQLVEESCTDVASSKSMGSGNKPGLMLVRDLNAGKGMLDDDGKPAVAKVFSRVIQISGADPKPKQLKSHHRGRSTGSCCRDRYSSQGPDKERTNPARPQSGQQRGPGQGRSEKQCPTCHRQFSDDTMEQHIVFCMGSSKDIM